LMTQNDPGWRGLRRVQEVLKNHPDLKGLPCRPVLNDQ